MAKTRRIHNKHSGTIRKKFCCEATFHGLHKWYEMEFEKLGWMVLAKSRGLKDKTDEYIMSLHRLRSSLQHKMTHIKEKDHKDDLEIMCNNVDILIDHAKRDFGH